MLDRLELGGGQGGVKCDHVAAQLQPPPAVVVCEVRMTLHAKTCCYSTLKTPLSILDDSGVVWLDLKNRVDFAHLLMRTDGPTSGAHCVRPLHFQGKSFAL